MTEEEPTQLRSVAPYQLMAAGPVMQLLAMKGEGRSRRTSGSYGALQVAVAAVIAGNVLATLNTTASQLRESSANRLYRRLNDGHAGRVALEEQLTRDVDAAIAAHPDTPARAVAPAPVVASTNRFAALAVDED